MGRDADWGPSGQAKNYATGQAPTTGADGSFKDADSLARFKQYDYAAVCI